MSRVLMPIEIKKMGIIKTGLEHIASPKQVIAFKKEYRQVLERLAPYKNRPLYTLRTVHDGTISREAGRFLYGLIRAIKPKTVLETGIYNGFSTVIILSALNKNGSGKLYSTDVREGVGQMVKKVDKSRWNKRIGAPSSVLKDVLKEIGRPDIFVHDSDHSYTNMLYEFSSAYKKMKGKGFILSDDVDMNDAFFDFAKSNNLRPRVVYSPIKLFGVIDLSERA